jgi:hypothetical protein
VSRLFLEEEQVVAPLNHNRFQYSSQKGTGEQFLEVSESELATWQETREVPLLNVADNNAALERCQASTPESYRAAIWVD